MKSGPNGATPNTALNPRDVTFVQDFADTLRERHLDIPDAIAQVRRFCRYMGLEMEEVTRVMQEHYDMTA